MIATLIASPTTRSGLKVFAQRDEGSSLAQVPVSDAGLEGVALHGDAFQPAWHDPREPRVRTWRSLTLHGEGATSALAWGAAAVVARPAAWHGGRVVDGVPRREVLD
jgi:hypothetical protein